MFEVEQAKKEKAEAEAKRAAQEALLAEAQTRISTLRRDRDPYEPNERRGRGGQGCGRCEASVGSHGEAERRRAGAGHAPFSRDVKP